MRWLTRSGSRPAFFGILAQFNSGVQLVPGRAPRMAAVIPPRPMFRANSRMADDHSEHRPTTRCQGEANVERQKSATSVTRPSGGWTVLP
jgi:hypothetical protein